MKRLFSLALGTSLAAALLSAESYSGTVVDLNCKGKDLASHTRKCAIACAKGGYGLVTADGSLMKFDEEGNVKALAALKTSAKDADLKAKVSGTKDGDVLKVDAIDLQ